MPKLLPRKPLFPPATMNYTLFSMIQNKPLLLEMFLPGIWLQWHESDQHTGASKLQGGADHVSTNSADTAGSSLNCRLIPKGDVCPNTRHCKLIPEGDTCPKHFTIKHRFSGPSASIYPVPGALPTHAYEVRAFNSAKQHAGESTQQWVLLPSRCQPPPRRALLSVSRRRRSQANF